MSLVSIAGFPVIDMRLSIPLKGRWHASVVAVSPGDPAPSSACDLIISQGNVEQLRAHGTPKQTDNPLDTMVLTLVAGANGLNKLATPRAYRDTTAGNVLRDLVSDAGERLSGLIDSSVMSTTLKRWSNVGHSVAAALDLLAQQLDLNWRFLLDGTLWLGVETWPEVKPTADVSQYDPLRKAVQVVTEDVLVLPGQTFQGQKVSYVQVDVLGGALRETVFFRSNSAGQSLRSYVDQTTAKVDFHALYTAVVTSQNSDGSCEITVDDARFPGFSKVPIKLGVPGATCKVQGGAKVLLGFDDGWPDAPYVALWETSSLSELNLNGGTDGIARKNDTVDIGTFAFSGLALNWTPPGGGGPVTLGTFVFTGSGALTITPGDANGKGKIDQGSGVVKCG